jgi:hypothetical protein
MLSGFLRGLPDHLTPGGEGWLVGLRAPRQVAGMIAGAGLRVAGRLDVRPRHRTGRPGDPPAALRAAEITSLWRLTPA